MLATTVKAQLATVPTLPLRLPLARLIADPTQPTLRSLIHLRPLESSVSSPGRVYLHILVHVEVITPTLTRKPLGTISAKSVTQLPTIRTLPRTRAFINP